MKVTRFIAYTVIAASVGISALPAKSLREGATPAEFPPASFKGGQYVDSKGCIYIRAGIDGNVTWVPRVSRKRQQICGYKPSLTAAEIANAPITKPTGAAPIQITVAPTATAPSKPAQVAAPAKPQTSGSTPAPVATVAPAAKPVPAAVASALAKPETKTPRRAPEPLVFVNPPPERVAAATAPVTPTTSSTTNGGSAPRPAPEPLVFVNPPPEQVAAATVPVTPTKTRPTRRSSEPRPAPVPLIFVNPPPERVAAATVPVTPTTNRTTNSSGAPRPAPKPLIFVNPPPEQVAAATVPVTPTKTRPARRSAQRPEPQPLIFVNPPAVQAPTTTVAGATAAPARVASNQACPDSSTFSQQYINSDARYPVRCGPQTAPPVNDVSSATGQTRTPSPAPEPKAGWGNSFGTCPDSSTFSQQYINSDAKYPVRCGPQTAPPVTTAYTRAGTEQNVPIDSTTRIVPLHVYEKRQNTTNGRIAKGYQNVWKDGRLNPRRAERTTAPAVIRQTAQAPAGYRSAWDDDRLNTRRVSGAAAGDAQTNLIWTQTVPRKLIVQPVSENKQIVGLSSRNNEQPVSTTSSRSAPEATPQAGGKPKYVRVATYETDASARTTAQDLARSGLPVRLGTVNRKGKAYRVVLAGPFASTNQAKAALAKIRGAGFKRAKISK